MNDQIIRNNRERLDALKAKHAASQKAHEERMAALMETPMHGEPISQTFIELELVDDNPNSGALEEMVIEYKNRCP